jgi:arylsulfatase A-like enzyme
MREAQEMLAARRPGYRRPADPFRLWQGTDAASVRRAKVRVGQETRNAFVFQTTAAVRIRCRARAGDRLVFSAAALVPGGTPPDQGVALAVHVRGPEGRRRTLFDASWAPGDDCRCWVTQRLKLTDRSVESLLVEFAADVQVPGAMCFVSDPHIQTDDRSRPNVVFCSIETWRRDHTSLHGYGRRTTPFLEELARSSLVFEEAHSQSSWTRPSVASMLTGLYPRQHRTLVALDSLDASLTTLPEILRLSGYRTAGFFTNEMLRHPAFNHDQGFDLFVDEVDHPMAVLVRDVLAWLDSEGPMPFLVFMHVYDPHLPYEAPGEYREVFCSSYDGPVSWLARLDEPDLRELAQILPEDVEYVKSRYDGELLYTDTMLKALVDGLAARGVWEDTLLVLVGDHGEEFYEHGGWGHGRDLLPEKLRVPLVIRLPGNLGGGQHVAGLASGVDLMPTVLSVLGLPCPDVCQGIDLVSSALESGHTGRSTHMAELWKAQCTDVEAATYEFTDAQFSLVTGEYQYIFTQFFRGAGMNRQRLFSMTDDPAATTDIAEERPDIAGRMVAELEQLCGWAGYVIAVSGDGGGPSTFSGTVHSEAPIVTVQPRSLEHADFFVLTSGNRCLSFALTVDGDDDALRFRTEPVETSLLVRIERNGQPVPRDEVFLGPGRAAPESMPLRLTRNAGSVDLVPGETVRYEAGRERGVFIWRQQAAEPSEQQGAAVDEETIRALRDLGYL